MAQIHSILRRRLDNVDEFLHTDCVFDLTVLSEKGEIGIDQDSRSLQSSLELFGRHALIRSVLVKPHGYLEQM